MEKRWRKRHLSCTKMKSENEVAQLCPTLCDPVDCVHEIFQARVLEWVAISFSRGSSLPRDWTWVSCFAGRFLTVRATREATYVSLLTDVDALGLICKIELNTLPAWLVCWEDLMKVCLEENGNSFYASRLYYIEQYDIVFSLGLRHIKVFFFFF